MSDPSMLADEDALLRGLRAGDDAAFEALVRAHGGRMLAVARRLLGSEEDAKDAVQDAFISAFRSIGTFEGGSRLATWLHRIAINSALMKLRTRQRKNEQSIEPLLPAFRDDGHAVRPARPWKESADQAVQRHELREFVRESIDRLPETHRIVLVLRDIEELDTEETGRLLGISESAVKTRLHRARQALRTLIDPKLSGEAA
jgi:RNA polymerase sigma-70 factor (ECF subfamily)